MAHLDKAEVLKRMSACGVVAVIRAPSKDVLIDITRATPCRRRDQYRSDDEHA